jgi:hypothetical protein
MSLIRYATIIVSQKGDVLVAVTDSGLAADKPVELSLGHDSFEIYQDDLLAGYVEKTPVGALKALATSRHALFVEVGTDGPLRTHSKVSIRVNE